MIWLASYSRSGNTYFRIVMAEMFEIESSEFHDNAKRKVAKNYQSYPLVKTHLLPEDVIPGDLNIPVIYLIRDGRDAVVSLAHHKIDFNKGNMSFNDTLEEVIVASGGSYFGGWSKHVKQWAARADVIIRFEDFILDPLKSIEKINSLVSLPPPINVPPSFQDLRTKKYKYGRGWKKNREKFFRRGVIGSWKDEMSAELHQLFLENHGKTLIKSKYLDGLFDLNLNALE